MIPVAILVGLLAGLFAGRLGWWDIGIVAVAWPVLLVVTEVDSGSSFLVGAAALAAVNAAIGVEVGNGRGRWSTEKKGEAKSHA